jgi:putative addiction module component (TIGR02574 family)
MVSPNRESILEAALRLPPEERLDLAESLRFSVDPAYLDEVEAAWAEEAEQRLDEVDRGEVTPLDGEELIRRLEAGECP